nr:STY0301 family protein [Paracidovorax avenae]
METTSMSLSRQIAALLLCLFGWSSVLAAPSVCPIRQNQPLRYIDVFDGEPSDLATLEPDVAKERYGHWVLGYIYDEGRFATLRCKYADKQTHDVQLAKRVEQCSYSINAKNVLQITCK